jgi:hypothetical protein
MPRYSRAPEKAPPVGIDEARAEVVAQARMLRFAVGAIVVMWVAGIVVGAVLLS